MENVVEVKNISKTFSLTRKQRKIENNRENKKVAVNNISFSVKEGEIYGLLGPNGAGKTTTLRLLATLIKPDSGSINICGYSLDKEEKIRECIGFLTSELKLEDYFTPNYLFTYFGKLYDLDDESILIQKEKLFKSLGIFDFAEVKYGNLSTGMKQKISLAISLINNPSVIIFDEPTNGLDIISTEVVIKFLLDLKKEGKTIILSTHIFSLVETLCDRVGIILDGSLVYEDTIKNNQKTVKEMFFDIYNKEEKNNETA